MNDLTIITIDNEPRILDTDLAERLGYAVPAQIRRLIKSHEAALRAMGSLFTEAVKTGGRPATAYYLNKPQAIFITTQSGTATAIEITIEVVKRFDEYERGLRKAPEPQHYIPKTYAEALQLAADQARELEAARPKVAFYDGYVEARGNLNTTQVAEILGFRSPQELNIRLYEEGVIKPDRRVRGHGWIPTAKYVNSGFFSVKTGHTKGKHVWTQMRWTPKGVAWAAERFGAAD